MASTPTLVTKFKHTSIACADEVPEDQRSLEIQVLSNGKVSLNWLLGDTLVDQAEFCINAYFNMLQEIPEWFANNGEPSYHASCDMPTVMFCVHDSEYPQIILGVFRRDDAANEAPEATSFVVLDRGTALTLLDNVGHTLASMGEDLEGCNSDENDHEKDHECSDDDCDVCDDETCEVSDHVNDPFAGLDTTVRH